MMADRRSIACRCGGLVPLALSAALLLISSDSSSAPKEVRTYVFISDTHMGIGKRPGGDWFPSEDFRWGNALRGFLNHVDQEYPGPVDLVVLGDFLELWQPYPQMQCSSPKAGVGCTVSELAELASRVSAAHSDELAAISEFVGHDENRVFIVPGNHDAALLEPEVWKKVADHFGLNSRVSLVMEGIWVSDSGLTVAEHGHQIGKDVNRFVDWPRVSSSSNPGHMARPWGEEFVQALFNEVEDEYPIIDNIAPESLGARYRLADKGAGRTSADLGRFILFNLFETSGSQKVSVLSAESDDQDYSGSRWSVRLGREAGYRLVVGSLPRGDSFASLILASDSMGEGIRSTLDEAIRDQSTFSDSSILQLCDQSAMAGEPLCQPALASSAMQSIARKESEVITPHVFARRELNPRMRNFIYGHTHEFSTPWPSYMGGRSINVANTGAFQRVANERQFLSRARPYQASEALRRVSLNDLAPCYTFVVVEGESESMRLWRWHQGESEMGGTRVSPSSALCD